MKIFRKFYKFLDYPSLMAKIFLFLPKRRVVQFLAVVVFSSLSTLLELAGFAVLIPMAVGSYFSDQPLSIFGSEFFEKFPELKIFIINNAFYILISLTILSLLVRSINLFVSSRFSYACGADLESNLFSNVLRWRYEEHLLIHSSEVISAITMKCTTLIYGVFMPIVAVVSSVTVLLFLSWAIHLQGDFLKYFPIFVVLVFYVGFLLVTSKYINSKGETVTRHSGEVQRVLSETLGNIREVIVHDAAIQCETEFGRSTFLRRYSQAMINFVSGLPRVVSESLLMVAMLVSVWWLSTGEVNVEDGLPLLIALAVVAQRALPVFQSGFNGLSMIVAAKPSVVDVISLFEHEPQISADTSLGEEEWISKHERLEFKNVSFRYKGASSDILDNINLTMPKGSRVAITGPSGVGKSTLVDLVCGLISPTSGEILIDGKRLTARNCRSWYSLIRIVSQNVVLQDKSVYENIAFGVSSGNIDRKRAVKCAKDACCHEFVEFLPQGYNTKLGERGSRLSGGQRQRLAIARALYSGSELIVLDEATSALDPDTERKVLESIFHNCKETTILVISHGEIGYVTFDRVVALSSER